MTFTAQPIFPGDIHDSAVRLGQDIARRRATLSADPLGLANEAARTAAELGWPALLIQESHDGADGQLSDLAAIAEGCGKTGLALPFTSLFAGPQHLLRAAGDQAATGLLKRLAAGEVALGLIRADRSADGNAPLAVVQEEHRFIVNGTVPAVDACDSLTQWLIVIDAADGTSERRLLLLENGADRLSSHFYLRADGRCLARLDFDGVALARTTELLRGARLDRALDDVARIEMLLTAAESVGAMGQLIEETIAYLSTRKQFGTTLSTFQGLRHQLAASYIEYENLRAQVQAAFDGADTQLPGARTASLLQLSLARTARDMGETAIQLHGGMGMTEELLAARLAKRLMMNTFENGGLARHLELAGAAVFGAGENLAGEHA